MFLRPKTIIDGAWSDWTNYGTYCHTECKTSRNRTCNNPTALFGGQNCTSPSEQELSPELCYGDECCPGMFFKALYYQSL